MVSKGTRAGCAGNAGAALLTVHLHMILLVRGQRCCGIIPPVAYPTFVGLTSIMCLHVYFQVVTIVTLLEVPIRYHLRIHYLLLKADSHC